MSDMSYISDTAIRFIKAIGNYPAEEFKSRLEAEIAQLILDSMHDLSIQKEAWKYIEENDCYGFDE